jgi:hypothetical protein
VRFHTGSTFLALGGMTAVVASLVVAQFVYVHAIGVTWIGMLNFLGVFIVLGVGADDIFVIHEFWKHSKTAAAESSSDDHHSEDGESSTERRLVERLRWTAEKSMYVVTMTSVTTAAAFACNMASRIAPGSTLRGFHGRAHSRKLPAGVHHVPRIAGAGAHDAYAVGAQVEAVEEPLEGENDAARGGRRGSEPGSARDGPRDGSEGDGLEDEPDAPPHRIARAAACGARGGGLR